MGKEIKELYFIIAQLYEDLEIEKTGDSLMFFAPYYMNKYSNALDFLKFYSISGDLNVLAQELIRKYCVSVEYSSKEDSDESFLNFLNGEYDKMRKVANALGENNLRGRH